MHTPNVSFDDQRPDVDDVARLARIGDAVRDRHRRSAAEFRRLEDASLVTVLLGCHDAIVTVHTSAGTEQVRGTVRAVGADVVEVLDGRRTWWLHLGAVTAVEGADLSPGDPADRAETSLWDLLADLVDSDRPVAALLTGGTTVHGTVRAAGAALRLRQAQPDRDVVISPKHLVAVAFAGDGPAASG